MEFLTVSWTSLHQTSFQLAQNITSHDKKHDIIVAIARGGMTIAQILSDLLMLPVATFTISSYKDMQQAQSVHLSYEVGGSLRDKHVLLVDDISDSGKTFDRGIHHLKEMGALHVTTAALFVKPWTKHLPDFSVTKTDKWVVFPYEVRETIEAVASLFKKEGKGSEEITNKLHELGIEDAFINTYFRDA